MERFSFIFLVAGLGFFALAFLVSGWFPMLPVVDLHVRTVEEMAQQQPLEFLELREQYPDAFEKAFGQKNSREAFAEALRIGHRAYIAEACWHCHSQQVRPWGNDEMRYGRVSFPEEYHNELNMPPLWGTRRIGPDLIRRGGKQSNDWHVAHFWRPRDVNPTSVMPNYPWFFEKDGLTPNQTGLSIITYVQWLGSWTPNLRETIQNTDSIERAYPEPSITGPTESEPAPSTPTQKPDVEAGTADDGGYGEDEEGDDEYGEYE